MQGTGLGMAITKSIVDLMGGSISVESAPGRGTRFEVVLEFPIATESDHVQKVQALPEEAEETSPLSGMKFLCAEDNAINAEILELLLESKGASCTICSNGQEIVDAFASVTPGEYAMIDGRADAGDGRPGGHPPHPQWRKSAGQNHPHPCHDRQRLP